MRGLIFLLLVVCLIVCVSGCNNPQVITWDNPEQMESQIDENDSIVPIVGIVCD